MNQKKLSICIPTYNRSRCLNNCLNSVKSFREKNAEKINNIIDENFSYENPSQRIADEILDFIRKHNTRIN